MNKEYNFDNGKWLVGNCLDLMKDIPDGSVDMVLCDPPYGIDYQSMRQSLRNFLLRME